MNKSQDPGHESLPSLRLYQLVTETHVHKQITQNRTCNCMIHNKWCCQSLLHENSFSVLQLQATLMKFCTSYVLFRCEKCQRAGGIESLRLCAKNFARLQEEFYVEYTMYDLSSVAVALVFPLVRIFLIYPLLF